MTQLINIFKWFLPNDNSSKIGLSQFREQGMPFQQKTIQKNNKYVKLSDLMRRVS